MVTGIDLGQCRFALALGDAARIYDRTRCSRRAFTRSNAAYAEDSPIGAFAVAGPHQARLRVRRTRASATKAETKLGADVPILYGTRLIIEEDIAWGSGIAAGDLFARMRPGAPRYDVPDQDDVAFFSGCSTSGIFWRPRFHTSYLD